MSRNTIIQLVVLRVKKGKMTRVPSIYAGGWGCRKKKENRKIEVETRERRNGIEMEVEMEPLLNTSFTLARDETRRS
jgi:hypothetical protein